MSYTTAINAIKAQLVAAPISSDHASVTLHYSPDPRIETLADLDGKCDAAFLLVAESAANPYPYAQGFTPTEWFTRMRLEVCTMLHVDILTQDKVAEARSRAVQEVVYFPSAAANGYAIYESQETTRARVGSDRRVIYTWKFSLRYTE